MQVNPVALTARNAIALERVDAAIAQMPTFLSRTTDESYRGFMGRTKWRAVENPIANRIAAGEQALLDVRLAIAQLGEESPAWTMLDRAAYEIDYGLGRLSQREPISVAYRMTGGARDEGDWIFMPWHHLGDAKYALQSEVRDARMNEVVALATARTNEMLAELTASGTVAAGEIPAAADDLATDLMAQNVRAAVAAE